MCWRLAKVPSYSVNPVLACAIKDRMKELGADRSVLERISKITLRQRSPFRRTTPDKCYQATVRAGVYGKRILL